MGETQSNYNPNATYITWNDDNREVVLAEYAGGGSEYFSRASSPYTSIEPNHSVRGAYSRSDYEFFRPNEALPKTHRDIIHACMMAARTQPIVSNVFNLMADFVVKGINLVHGNDRIQRLYRRWAKQIDLPNRAEQFVRLLLRAGNVPVYRETARLLPARERDLKLKVAKASFQSEYGIPKRHIPVRYTFLNPCQVRIKGGDTMTWYGPIEYEYMVNTQLLGPIVGATSRDDRTKQLIQNLPDALRNAAKDRSNVVPLKNPQFRMFFYKKNDWELWSDPLLYPLLEDLIQYQKMKLADIAALDGAIRHIRIWKLGSLEHRILPGDAAFERLRNQLLSNVHGGEIDLIWGPDIVCESPKSELAAFLGSEKYQIILGEIYQGLGIPSNLTGGKGEKGGFSADYFSLKTLTERLDYCRQVLTSWLDFELKLIADSLGFGEPAKVVFDRTILTDEAAEKALLIQLVDRDLISHETVQELFGTIPEIENLRQRRESAAREKGTMPQKASQWHDPQQHLTKEKILLQQGVVTPSEVGVELKPKKSGEKNRFDLQEKLQRSRPATQQNIGVSGQGRPKNAKDKKKRKSRRILPRTSAYLWARDAQNVIANTIHPVFLAHAGKKNLRQLSDEDVNILEEMKFRVLCTLTEGEAVTEERVLDVVKAGARPNQEAVHWFTQMLNEVRTTREPRIDEIRDLQALAIAASGDDTDG